jgi:hypothetical protein
MFRALRAPRTHPPIRTVTGLIRVPRPGKRPAAPGPTRLSNLATSLRGTRQPEPTADPAPHPRHRGPPAARPCPASRTPRPGRPLRAGQDPPPGRRPQAARRVRPGRRPQAARKTRPGRRPQAARKTGPGRSGSASGQRPAHHPRAAPADHGHPLPPPRRQHSSPHLPSHSLRHLRRRHLRRRQLRRRPRARDPGAGALLRSARQARCRPALPLSALSAPALPLSALPLSARSGTGGSRASLPRSSC